MRENLIELAYCFVMALLILGMIVAIQHFTLKSKEPIENVIDEVTIKAHPVETEADPPLMVAQEAYIASDTPVEDADSDNFEMLCNCVYAESGNQSDYGIRLCADVIINRAGGDVAKIDDVISAPYQFSSYSDGGMQKWCDVPEKIIQLCAQEIQSRTNTQVWYFRTGHFSEYGTPWQKVGDHYFSCK